MRTDHFAWNDYSMDSSWRRQSAHTVRCAFRLWALAWVLTRSGHHLEPAVASTIPRFVLAQSENGIAGR
jgi:hypothetical protein